MSQDIDSETAPLCDLTAFQRDLLKVVRDLESGEPIGQDIINALETVRGENIKAGRFYPNVTALERKGLIERHNAKSHGKIVALTDDGRDAVQERADWWQGDQTGGRR